MYNEIANNIEDYRTEKGILQGYIKRLCYSYEEWFCVEADGFVEWLQKMNVEEHKEDREILEFWQRVSTCKHYLEDNIKALLEEYGLNNGEPQQIGIPKELCTDEAKSNRQKGRPKETFKDKLVNDEEGKRLKLLHSLIDGKVGKDVALVILIAIEKGWIRKPTFTQVKEEFGDIGVKSGYCRYLDKKCYSEEEIKGVVSLLE